MIYFIKINIAKYLTNILTTEYDLTEEYRF